MRTPVIVITPEILRLIAAIDEFKGWWSAGPPLPDSRLAFLRRTAVRQSFYSCCRQEGLRCTEPDDFPPEGRSEANWRRLSERLLEGPATLPSREPFIRQLHDLLLAGDKDAPFAGRYKQAPNYLPRFASREGRRPVIVSATEPADAPAELLGVTQWLGRAIQGRAFHPLLLTAFFVLKFLLIQPFAAGNARLAHLLSLLLLLRAGYAHLPYYSLPRILERHQDEYARALHQSHRSLGARGDFPDWLVFFLRMMRAQQSALRQETGRLERHEHLPPLAEAMLEMVRERGKATISDFTKETGANRNTVKVRLRELVAAGHLQQRGRGKATWYRPTGAAGG